MVVEQVVAVVVVVDEYQEILQCMQNQHLPEFAKIPLEPSEILDLPFYHLFCPYQ